MGSDSTEPRVKKRKVKHSEIKPPIFTPDLRAYVTAAFDNCLPGKESELESELRAILLESDTMTDWRERPLPASCGGLPNPNRSQKSTPRKATSNPSPGTSTTGGIIPAELTFEEQQARERRAMRFQNDRPVKSSENNKAAEFSIDGRIVGTSQSLEKPYFRLTSAPDPSTVRPLPVLQQAYKQLKKRWGKDQNYTYTCEQFKSIRQDLTVQGIRNDFSVMVYEYHARIALQMGDLSEYNQCQSQLKELYADDAVSISNGEFHAYEILYLLFSGNRAEMNSLLEKRALAKAQRTSGKKKKSKALKHALGVRSALASGNYHQFFKLYQEAPNRNALLMDQFVPRERVKALLMLCKSFPMGLPLDFIEKELAFYSVQEVVEFLSKHGITVDQATNRLDTKAALPHINAAIANKYRTADIKGQK